MRGWGRGSGMEPLPIIFEALASIPSRELAEKESDISISQPHIHVPEDKILTHLLNLLRKWRLVDQPLPEENLRASRTLTQG